MAEIVEKATARHLSRRAMASLGGSSDDMAKPWSNYRAPLDIGIAVSYISGVIGPARVSAGR